MFLFRKKDEHAGSGIDDPKGVVEKVAETVKSVATPAPKPVEPPKTVTP